MPKQITIPEQYAEVFRDSVLDDIEFGASGLEDFIKCMRKRFEATDRRDYLRASNRLELAQALYDQIDGQGGSLVVDVTEATLGCLPVVVEWESEKLQGDAQAIVNPDNLAQMRQRLDGITFWVDLIESLQDEYAELFASREHEREAVAGQAG